MRFAADSPSREGSCTMIAMKRAGAARARGFTLIELMIVVVIVGILATMGFVGYRKMIAEAHSSEAISVINSIKVAQEAYHAEARAIPRHRQRHSLQDPSCKTLYPQGYGTRPNPANPSSATSIARRLQDAVGRARVGQLQRLGVQRVAHVPGAQPGERHLRLLDVRVHRRDRQVVGAGGGARRHDGLLALGRRDSQDYYVVTAVGDVDADGLSSLYVGSSFNADVMSYNEGE